MSKTKNLKVLSILSSVLVIFFFLSTSTINAATLTRYSANITEDLFNVKVKNLTTGSETIMPKSQYTNNINANGLTTESTREYIPNSLGRRIGFDGSLTDRISPKSIIGTDDRYKVDQTTSFPYSAICYLEMEFPSGAIYVGSAWMYSENVAVTAGHCVYSADDGGWATKIKVVPGMNGTSAPFGTAYATSISAPEGWTDHGSSDYDWGVIQLNKNIGNDTGYFGASWTSGSLNKSNIDVVGYPGEKRGTMWRMSGNITNATANKIYYTLDTTGGQSGCPVYENSNSGTQALAIHTTGSSYTNSGTRITKEVFDYINLFREK